MRDFRGAGICIGQGNFESIETRQAVKLALLLTNPDGAAYSPLFTKVLFDASDTEIAENSQSLVEEGRRHEFDSLCIYLAGRLQNSATGWNLRGTGAGETSQTLSLKAVAAAAVDVRSKSAAIFIDVGTSQIPDSPEFLQEIRGVFASLSRPLAVIVGAQAEKRSRAGTGTLATTRCPNELLLEWFVGRDTAADAAINVDAFRGDASLAQGVRLNVPLAEETHRVRLGARFPWLIWSQRTTIPGHAIRSLQNFVDQNCEVISDRIRKDGLTRRTLAGLPASLYSAMWQEAFEEESLDLMDRLERDRNILKLALRANDYNRSATAAAMGISRSTLYAKLRRLNISIDQLRNGNRV